MRAVLVLLALMLALSVPAAHATTRPDLIVGVDVALRTKTVTLSSTQVRRGYYVQFKVRNTTSSRRIFRDRWPWRNRRKPQPFATIWNPGKACRPHLIRAKRHYDPDNVFRAAIPLPVASAMVGAS